MSSDMFKYMSTELAKGAVKQDKPVTLHAELLISVRA